MALSRSFINYMIKKENSCNIHTLLIPNALSLFYIFYLRINMQKTFAISMKLWLYSLHDYYLVPYTFVYLKLFPSRSQQRKAISSYKPKMETTSFSSFFFQRSFFLSLQEALQINQIKNVK